MKNKVLTALLLTLFVASTGWCSWTTRESTTTQDLNAVALATQALGLAVGNSGTVIKTLNGGQTWESKASGVTVALYDVMLPSATEGYLAGASGTILKTANLGDTFNAITLPSGVNTAAIKKAAWHNNLRGFAASNGAASNGAIITGEAVSGDVAAWNVTTIANFDVAGVAFATTESGGADTYVWGRYFAGADSGKYAILKNGTAVQTFTGNAIRDIFFSSAAIGYAVGENGFLYKTTDNGESWFDASSGTTNNLNSLLFITDNFGWAVGDVGNICLTTSGGVRWTNCSDTSISTDLNDIGGSFTIASTSDASGVGLIVGDGGKVYKLSSPSIEAVSPTTKPQGGIGTMEITGSGFMAGATVAFLLPGTSDSDPGLIAAAIRQSKILATAVSVESSTRLVLNYISSTDATLGARDVRVVNIDASSARRNSAFTLVARTANPAIANAWVDNNKYVAALAPFGISTKPLITFEATSTAGMTPATANAKVIAISGESYSIFNIPAASITATSANTVSVSYKLSGTLASGTAMSLKLYVEDSAGNPAQSDLSVETSGLTNPTSESGAKAGLPGVIIGNETKTDLSQSNYVSSLHMPAGTEVVNPKFILIDAAGKRIWEKTIPGTYYTKVNFTIAKNEVDPKLLGYGIYIIQAWDTRTGKLIAQNRFVNWKN